MSRLFSLKRVGKIVNKLNLRICLENVMTNVKIYFNNRISEITHAQIPDR